MVILKFYVILYNYVWKLDIKKDQILTNLNKALLENCKENMKNNHNFYHNLLNYKTQVAFHIT